TVTTTTAVSAVPRPPMSHDVTGITHVWSDPPLTEKCTAVGVTALPPITNADDVTTTSLAAPDPPFDTVNENFGAGPVGETSTGDGLTPVLTTARSGYVTVALPESLAV